MPDVTTTSWFPVVTLVVGYVLKSIMDIVQHSWSVTKDREAREAARQDKQFERRITFQRDTLLALQDATMDLGRATARMHHLDVMAFRNTNIWQRQPFPDDLDEGYRLAHVRTGMLSVRARDETVRRMVGDLRTHCDEAGRSADHADSVIAMQRMGSVLDELNERIGEVLRKIDEVD